MVNTYFISIWTIGAIVSISISIFILIRHRSNYSSFSMAEIIVLSFIVSLIWGMIWYQIGYISYKLLKG